MMELFALRIQNRVTPLTTSEISIGRHTKNKIVINSSLKVSREHAVIVFLENKPFLKDISSSDWGTYIFEHRILPKREVLLKVGDLIGIGSPANEDKNCTLELLLIDSRENSLPSNQGLEPPLTQPFEFVRPTAHPLPSVSSVPTIPIQPIDITEPEDDEVIHITDEEDLQVDLNTSVKEDRSSPSIFFNEPTSTVSDVKNVTTTSFNNVLQSFDLKQKSSLSNMNNTTVPQLEILKPAPSQRKKSVSYINLEEESDKSDDDSLKKNPNEKHNAVPAFRNIQTSTIPVESSRIKTEFSANNLHDNEIELRSEENFTDTMKTAAINVSNENSLNIKSELRNSGEHDTNIKSEFSEFLAPQSVPDLNYSMMEEIISLDSDEEDFPSSQLNTTKIVDVPDYSSTFEMMYDTKPELNFDDDDQKTSLNDDGWFEYLSQSNLIDDKRLESSKEFRQKNRDLNDVVLTSHVDKVDTIPLEINEAIPSVTIREPSSSKIKSLKIIKSLKVPIIEPAPLKRKRRTKHEQDFASKRRNREGSESPDTIARKMLEREKNRKNSSSSSKHRHKHLSLTPSQMQRNKDDRKAKLKEMYAKSSEKNEQEKAVKISTHEPKVKLTHKNRGDFLTELPSESARTSKKDGDSKKKKANELSGDSNGGSDVKQQSTAEVADLIKILEGVKTDEKLEISTSVKDSGDMKTVKTSVSNMTDILRKNQNIIGDEKCSNRTITFGSILKSSKFSYDDNKKFNDKKKRVTFNFKPKAHVIHCDNEVYPLYKVYESLIRGGQMEFEAALTKVCSWNVRWLEEQQNQVVAPPVYPPIPTSMECPNFIDKYKEQLKFSMFHSFWKKIFNAWNSPENDDLPFTQLIGNNNVLQIEKIDAPRMGKFSKPLWTIYAKRDATMLDPNNNIINGVLVILNFRVLKNDGKPPTKTMVFAYIASVNRCREGDRFIDKVVFKIFAKPFQIVPDTIKMKTLTYVKMNLRQFQAFAMLHENTCPIIRALCDPNYNEMICDEPNFNQIIKNKFLDPSQRKAAIIAHHCILNRSSSTCLINGAAGTGKSQTIVTLLSELFSGKKNVLPSNFKALVITSCDKDADDLIYRLETSNRKEGNCMNLLRFGNCSNLHGSVVGCGMDKQIENHLNNNPDLINLNEEQNNLRAKINSAELVLNSKNVDLNLSMGRKTLLNKQEEAKIKLQLLRQELEEMTSENSMIVAQLKLSIAKEMTISKADVVVTEVNSCWSSNFENYFVPTCYNKGDVQKFNVCIFDDANIYNEIVMLIPVMLCIPHLILVGDQKCRAYSDSPYHRMLANFSACSKDLVVQLEVEHRLCPELMDWVSKHYKMDVKQNSSIRRRSLIRPYLVIDHGKRDNDPYGPQILICEKILEGIMQLEKNENSRIGFIVATNYQKEAVKSVIQAYARKVSVELLNGYNGREQDIVVLCLPYPYQMFSDWLYIAVTRAKSTLIVCGNCQEIEDAHIQLLVENAKQRNLFVPFQTRIEKYNSEHMQQLLSWKM